MKTKSLRGEKGQAAILITILLMFALIALTALAIDGGHLYVVRRDLQNMCDAACLAAATELSLGSDTEAAIAKGREYVIRNGGEFFSDWSGPEDNVGSGTGLTWGIQVAGADVRVALQEDVDTYFTMIFNRSSALVGAGSRCNSQSGGVLLPIAVRRYDYHEPAGMLDLFANKDADPRNPLAPCWSDPEVGCVYPETSDEVFLPGRYSEGEPTVAFRPVLDPYVPTTGTLTSTVTGNIDCAPPNYKGDLEYVGVCILGEQTDPNDQTKQYAGFVSLDIRNIAGSGPIEYYNGAGGQDATNKAIALAEGWFCEHGWTGGPLPMLGDQLAFLPGVSVPDAIGAMRGCNPPWKAGDQFVAVIYSGYVWAVPHLEMSIDPAEGHLCSSFPCSITDTVSYTINLWSPKDSPPWPPGAQLDLNWFMEESEVYHVITPTVTFSETTVDVPPDDNPVSVTMTVSVTNPITETYLSALTVMARETTVVGLKRWASTNFAYGDITGLEDFTFYAHELEFDIPRGGLQQVGLTTRGFGFADNKAPLRVQLVHGPCWPTCAWQDVFTSGQDDTIKIQDGTDSDGAFSLKVKNDAMLGTYTVRLTANHGGDPHHAVDIALNVYDPTGGAVNRFVIVEGFAPFEISYIGGDDVNDPNTIAAFAIGPVVPDLSQVTLGTKASLLPW